MEQKIASHSFIPLQNDDPWAEIGFQPLIDKLLPMVERLAWDLFPEMLGGTGLDSYKVSLGVLVVAG